MRFQRFLSYLIPIFLIAVVPLPAKEDHRTEFQPVALELAQSLPHQGILKQKDNGFVYLDVSNDFIDEIVEMLNIPGQLRPRPTATRSVGAHISVFHEKEAVTPHELGSSFSFEVSEIRSFTLHTRDGLKKLWVIAVSSPELEALRASYGHSPLLKGYDFHITLGKQMPAAPEGWQYVETLSELDGFDSPFEGLYDVGDFEVVEHPDLLATAMKVDMVGQLTLKSNGYVYLNVDDAFIENTVDMLPIEGVFKPVSTGAKKMGAHISVMLEDETIGHEIWELSEAGQWFTFQVKQLRSVDVKTASGPTRLWLLAVECPGLERLRESYGLKAKLQHHDFHITLGRDLLIAEPEMDLAA